MAKKTSHEKFYDSVMDLANMYSGLGGYSNQIQTMLRGFDRYQINNMIPNKVSSGLVFMTRPRLNLQSSSLRMSRDMATLETTDVNSVNYMIRALLDTEYCKVYRPYVARSPLVDPFNPFIPLVTNCIQSMDGVPDLVLETETSDGGFQSEDITYPIGSDMLRKSYDFTLTFKDVPGGPLFALFYYWMLYISHLTKGLMSQYTKDSDDLRMGFTASIYRFTFDHTQKRIAHAMKGTGCFPIASPTGALFNISKGESDVEGAKEFSIPFKVNHVTVLDPIIYREFNAVVRKYNGTRRLSKMAVVPFEPEYNFTGLPWIAEGPELYFLSKPDDMLYNVRHAEMVLSREAVIAESGGVSPSGGEVPTPEDAGVEVGGENVIFV